MDGWYAQSITVGYERARGLRAPGEHADGFAVGASKTIAVPVARLFDAFEEPSATRAMAAGSGHERADRHGSEDRPATTGRTDQRA